MATTSEALKRRDQLREESSRAREVRENAAARAAELREQLKPMPRNRRRLLAAAARSGEDLDVGELDQKQADLEAEAERESDAARAAGEAAKQAEAELVRLHHDEFPAFAEGAAELAQKAEAKLAEIERGYHEAFEAIEAAASEWKLLIRDFNRILIDRSDSASRARGEVKRRSLSPPPPNPLRDPAETFGIAIRPPELALVEEVA